MLFRMAPTPSGYLHIGNAVNFVLTWMAARQRGAKLLLRIDDIDAERKRPEYVDDIFRTLDWLGLTYDCGPSSVGDFEVNWSQQSRISRYKESLESLRASGTLYACGLSRRKLQSYGTTYPAEGRAQNLSLDEPDVAWRFLAEGSGEYDFIVRRREGTPSYQIASLTDDHDFGVTHLVRGLDLLESTDRQRQLAQVLGWNNFSRAQVWHHSVLTDPSGNKLSKSSGAGLVSETSIRALEKSGNIPTVIFTQVARLLNAPDEVANSLTNLLSWEVPGHFFAAVETVKLS